MPSYDQPPAGANGVYKFDGGYKWLILVAGSLLFLLVLGSLITASIRNEILRSGLMALGVVELAAVIAVAIYVVRRSQRTLQINDEGIFMRNRQGNEISSIRWIELGRVSERREMGQLELWDQDGRRRLTIDQQFKPFAAIRSRILDEYAKAFTPRALPMELRSSYALNPQTLLIASCAAFFVWAAWSANRQNARSPAMLLSLLAILSLVCLFSLFPQLRGPSVLFEDRIVLRSLFRTKELYKRDIANIELKDVANSSGTKFSLIAIRTTSGKQATITFAYGNIPEIYLTLRAWLSK